jgi:hypothetical protein
MLLRLSKASSLLFRSVRGGGLGELEGKGEADGLLDSWSGVSAVLLWCYRDVPVVFQWCHSGVIPSTIQVKITKHARSIR